MVVQKKGALAPFLLRSHVDLPLHGWNVWSYRVAAITLDYESNNPGSNPGRTSIFVFFLKFKNMVVV